jgi:Cellulase (glycosyl hydrolase family 5)
MKENLNVAMQAAILLSLSSPRGIMVLSRTRVGFLCARRIRTIASCSVLLLPLLHAAGESYVIDDFDGPLALQHWHSSGDLSLGPGHQGQGAVLAYRFPCGQPGCDATALWTPGAPLPKKNKPAISLWLRASPEVGVTISVKDSSGQTSRLAIPAATLEDHDPRQWRNVVVPLSHEIKGHIAGIGVTAQPRYTAPMQGAVSFDEIRLLETKDAPFRLTADSKLATPSEPRELAPRMGVNIHVLRDNGSLDQAHDAGFRFVRMDLMWAQVERAGRFRFFQYDALLRALDSRAMGVLWILDYGHPDHGGDAPRTPQDVAAFARFAQEVAGHFKGRNVRYEIWNEPDNQNFWKPSPDPRQYAVLLREASTAIRQADPAAVISSGGTIGFNLPFISSFAGAARELNAIAVHPYRKTGPETIAPEYIILRDWVARALGPNVALWDTEWGYSSAEALPGNGRVDGHGEAWRIRQAVFAVREALTTWTLGIPLAVWYDLRDDGMDQANPEHNFGLLDSGGGEKPAMKAIRVLSQASANRKFAGLVPDKPAGTHAMRLDGTSDIVFIVWSTEVGARIAIRVPKGSLLSATNMLGEPVNTKNKGSDAEVTLSEAAGPVYLHFQH